MEKDEPLEIFHAKEAINTGYYINFSNPLARTECVKVGSKSLCFCDHLYKDHDYT